MAKSKSQTQHIPPPYKVVAPPPIRNNQAQLVFLDWPQFRPNLTPKEVLQMGSFGGTYFRPIYSSITRRRYGDEVWRELPEDWLEGLDIRTQVASETYYPKQNMYGVKSGGSLEMWEQSGWMRAQDPYGWFQWFCRFYQGRRNPDDERQVGRWVRCAGVKGRWRHNLVGKVVRKGAEFDDPSISPVVRQTLQHWGYRLNREDFDRRVKEVKRKGGEEEGR